MSHYTEVETEFKNKEALLQALTIRMGYSVEVHEGKGANLYGYRGDVRPQKANIIIRRKNVGPASNDLGWKWDAEKKCFTQIISEYDIRRKHFDEGKLKQNYNDILVQKQAVKFGYRVQRKVEEGQIQLVLTKY